MNYKVGMDIGFWILGFWEVLIFNTTSIYEIMYIYFLKPLKMKTLIFVLFVIGASTILVAKPGNFQISGQVQNHLEPTINITYINNKKMASANLDAEGNFSISAAIEEGYYLLSYGRNTSYLYLHPNDHLKLTFDANHFENTLMFIGRGAERNNYLAKKSAVGAKLTEDLDAFYKVDEASYLSNIENIKNTHTASLAKYDVEAFFKKAELKSLEYQRLLSIQNYKSNYKFYIGEVIIPSSDFYLPLESLDLNDEDDYKTQPYYRYVVNSLWSDRIDAAADVDGMLAVFRQVRSNDLATSLVNGFYSEISTNKERSKDYLDLIKRITKQKRYIEAAEKKYQESLNAQGLNKGAVSPNFSFENLDGHTVNLHDLKGKYVYIDIWATWCSPCLKQVPYLKELEERYRDEEIVFVSISVDKNEFKDAWKQMIADKQLGGLQLFADKSFDSDFLEAYAVNSIPRFILIDPEGKIVDPEAPQPSFARTKTLLDELLN